ncbi:MAG: hypothetical protein A3H98_12530 [Bacteroidetes bacterium RIFCSPLOWO2_02_FULL_36_8]|nr:MAG: hypothetical protein A3H98_12530 [Bacteroidetes bacterium RIFCSPLOWO2_02_FULL_36_8]OFY69923.1 MAG: hypothetical protein A3G23_05550 [Bacteroidetes bacterium RIFCSPLOWO2_12_FULL_37_12]
MTIFTAIQVTYGQISFSHSGGASFYGSSLASAPGLMYSPRINFLELRDELTISAGTHLGLGVVYSRDEGASSFAFDLPLVAEINFGHGANPDTRSSFGGFGGFGFGISKIGSAGAFGADYNDAAGIVLNGGIRAIINKNPLGLRLSYLINTKEGFENVISLGIFFTFGDF